jgi:hypothetical protein
MAAVRETQPRVDLATDPTAVKREAVTERELRRSMRVETMRREKPRKGRPAGAALA